MKKTGMRVGAAALAMAVAQVCNAGSATYFQPLTASIGVTTPNNLTETTSGPWVAPSGMSQRNLTSMEEAEANAPGRR